MIVYKLDATILIKANSYYYKSYYNFATFCWLNTTKLLKLADYLALYSSLAVQT